MKTDRAAYVALVVAIILVVGVWRAGPKNSPETTPTPQTQPSVPASPQLESIPTAHFERFRTQREADPLIGLVGEGLNADSGSIERDLDILTEVLDAWQSNFPGGGNPVGTNLEITRALTGRNRLKLDLIPADHPAVNSRGELCDRWGTPFEFHQISGSHMEIRSAGPDRVLYTDDDVVGNPGPTY